MNAFNTEDFEMDDKKLILTHLAGLSAYCIYCYACQTNSMSDVVTV